MTNRNPTERSEEQIDAVVAAIAEETSVDPTALPPLFESVDPEALVRLIESASRSLSVRFQHAGFEIRIDETGDIRFDPTDMKVPQQ